MHKVINYTCKLNEYFTPLYMMGTVHPLKLVKTKVNILMMISFSCKVASPLTPRQQDYRLISNRVNQASPSSGDEIHLNVLSVNLLLQPEAANQRPAEAEPDQCSSSPAAEAKCGC